MSSILARTSLRAVPRLNLATQRGASFSTSRAVLAGPEKLNANSNPSYPAFSLKHISANPRIRFYLGAMLLGLATLEGAAWIKFWPKITGRDKSDEEDQDQNQ